MIIRVHLLILLLTTSVGAKEPAKPKGPTFNRDIAPIVFSHCVTCHHPNGNTPFPLTTYGDVRKRAKLIAKVTASRQMPPWLPEPGHGDFIGERRLTEDQITLFDRWQKAGTPEGAASDLQVQPQWSDDWQLGKPDVVLSMPKPYLLRADGPDVYRNFVIPGNLTANRFLRAVEFRPNSTGAIHHAFVLVENTGSARRRAERFDEPGFPGMDTAGAGAPSAMFMSWQPGKNASEAPPGVSAPLQPSTDFVIQLHMRPTGKPESIQPSIGLYFTDKPPERFPLMLLLRSIAIDIPAGASDYSIESSYQLPVDVDVTAVLPHMHYLGKEMHGWAELPDGRRRELLLIKRWDFAWQGDYRYEQPIFLPKGSTVHMRAVYDNSARNPRNPNQPPKRVTYGLESTDEMGELWLQLIPPNAADGEVLRNHELKTHALPDAIALSELLLKKDPKDAVQRTELAAALIASGRMDEAVQALEQAILDDPTTARPHFLLGHIYMSQGNAPKAREALEQAVKLDPADYGAHANLGWILLATGKVDAAIEHLERAVELNPADPRPRQNLETARSMKNKR
jgi:Tetratricopeptide repeat